MRDTADRHHRGVQEQAVEFGRPMMEQRVRGDKRMELLERHVASMQRQGVPTAPVPPTQGTEEIRSAVRETAEHIQGNGAEMLGQAASTTGGHQRQAHQTAELRAATSGYERLPEATSETPAKPLNYS